MVKPSQLVRVARRGTGRCSKSTGEQELLLIHADSPRDSRIPIDPTPFLARHTLLARPLILTRMLFPITWLRPDGVR